jgi:hypothetical protein
MILEVKIFLITGWLPQLTRMDGLQKNGESLHEKENLSTVQGRNLGIDQIRSS